MRFCCCFPVKFNFCRNKSATKFLCVKISIGIVVATSFLYLTVHIWIAGDIPIYLKFVLKVKFGVHVDHSKSQPTDDKLSQKGCGHCHVTSLIFLENKR